MFWHKYPLTILPLTAINLLNPFPNSTYTKHSLLILNCEVLSYRKQSFGSKATKILNIPIQSNGNHVKDSFCDSFNDKLIII